MFSPDGRWLAYNSNESGRDEVYVRAFPGPGGPWKISAEGGASPQWSRTRPEIFYVESGLAETRIMVAPFTAEGSQFRPGPPVPWSPRGFAVDEDFELHPDGKRVATGPTERSAASTTDQVVILLNIQADLKRLAPPSRSP
jgi:serine/threonine-protein kinase